MDPRANPVRCFFCNELIEGKRSKEHIIPDHLLAMLSLKQEHLFGRNHVQYSRIKVPAHKQCNETFASRYESVIRELLLQPAQLYESVVQEDLHTSVVIEPSMRSVELFRTWLTKIYYGLFYFDSLNSSDTNWAQTCKIIVEAANFRLIQKAYSQNVGFLLPSSLFAFKTERSDFDLVTLAAPQMILLKFREYVYILCLSDGLLTQSYMTKESTAKMQHSFRVIEAHDEQPRVHLLLMAEILALRLSIPKSPSFIIEDNRIHNLSFNTMVKNPTEYYKIDETTLESNRIEAIELVNSIATSG